MTNTGKNLIWGYIVIFLILLLAGGITLKHYYVRAGEKTAEATALTDTVHHYKTKNRLNAAYIQTIVSERSDLIAVASKKDSVIAKLLKANKHIQDITHVQSVATVDTITRISPDSIYIVKNGIKEKTDSVVIDKTIKNKWYVANISVRADSLHLKLKTYDEFVVDHEFKPQGFFKADLLNVNVINLNPNSINTGLSSYQIAVHKPGIWLPFGAGVISVFLLGLFLHK